MDTIEATTLETAKANGHEMAPRKDITRGWERRISWDCKTCEAFAIVYIVYDANSRSNITSADGSALNRKCKE